MRCPRCDVSIPSGSGRCPECGLEVEPEASGMEAHSRRIAASRERWQSGSPFYRSVSAASLSPSAAPRDADSREPAPEDLATPLRCETLPYLNLMLLHAGYSPFRSIHVAADTTPGANLSVRFHPAVAEAAAIRLDRTRSGAPVSPPTVTPDPTAFYELDESIRGRIEVTLSFESREVGRWNGDVIVQSGNEWISQPAYGPALAGAVTPNHGSIARLLGELPVDVHAYQSGSRRRLRRELRAVYDTIGALGLQYVSDPPSFDGTGQKILFPDEVLAHRRGCCIDIGILTAAVLERLGYNPLIVLVRGHALVGAWTADIRSRTPALDEPSRLRQAIRDDELLVWNTTTYFERESDAGFESALGAGRRLLDKLEYAIDIAACRRAAFPHAHPLPRPSS